MPMLKNILWIIPFACFAAGYFATRSYFAIAQFPIPCVEGKSLYEAVTELSNHQLSLKLLRIKKESEVPHGTIIRQIPAAGQMVKPRQTVFITVSEQPPLPPAPDMIGKPLEHIETELRTLGIRGKSYTIASAYPKNTCIAQYPAAHQPITDKVLTLYIAQPHSRPYILPDFTDMPAQEAIDLLESYDITPEIVDAKRRSPSKTPLIIDQRPLPGSLIVLDSGSKPNIQLHVQ
jgi:beta-lactam-binding protein with PASTA domain